MAIYPAGCSLESPLPLPNKIIVVMYQLETCDVPLLLAPL
jgi:hypothetical protein